jgi:hypothetical protein
MRRDLHFRVSERDYRLLLQLAAEADETMAATLRRVIRRAWIEAGGVAAMKERTRGDTPSDSRRS